MSDVIFCVGPICIKWYSVCILLGVIVAYLISAREAERFNIGRYYVFNMMFWVLIFGIIGARLYYVLFNLDYYLENLTEIYKIWNGGLAIHGGIIVGALVILIYCKKYKVKTNRMLDIVAPSLLIAQAIGRWGNFFNGEAYGSAVTLGTLQKLLIPNFVINGMYINGVYYLPMFYFESIWCIIGFIVLLIVRRLKYTKIGQLTGIYLMWYSFGRFFIEIFRTDSLYISGFKMAQVTSVILFIVGFIIVLIGSRKPKLEDLYNDKNAKENIMF